jgi:GAF domain-containing protein
MASSKPQKPTSRLADQDLEFSSDELRLLNRISHHLANADDLRQTLSLVLDWLADERGMQRGVISLINEENAELYASITGHDIEEANASKMRYRPG